MSRIRIRRIMVVLAALCVVVVGVPASAADGAPRHCVYFVVDQAADGELIMDTPQCFDSFTDAIAVASGGDVTLAPGTSPSEFLENSTAVASTFTIGIHYDGYGGSGSSISVVGSSCTGGWWNTPTWFDNLTSSSYAGCYRLRHFDKPNKAGSSYTTYGSGVTHNLYAFNNQTESVQYLP